MFHPARAVRSFALVVSVFIAPSVAAQDFPTRALRIVQGSAPGGNADANPRAALLTMDDILGLKLDADWVVLSACNSGAGDGKGSDAISGLGRAFFYAGAKALLVTSWPVETVSARLLTTDAFRRQSENTLISRSRAMQESSLDLMKKSAGSFSYAHPLFWAPYVVVGDGG